MNHYGEMARDHWARWLPSRYARIPDPDAYFTTLGQEAARRIGDLMVELAGRGPPGEDYLAMGARLQAARRQAEEIILAELILLSPEPAVEQTDAQEIPSPRMVPRVVTRDHPMWAEVNAEQLERLQDS